jgi:hypothetical protein
MRGAAHREFATKDLFKLKLLKRLIESHDDLPQTTRESRVMTQMLVRIERAIGDQEPQPRQRRKPCAYGSRIGVAR